MELFSVIFVIVLIGVAFRSLSGSKLPPSPWGLPLIGHLHHIAKGIPKQSFLKLSRKYGPIVFLRLGLIPAVVVSTPELAKEVLKNQDSTFASRPFFIYAKYVQYNFSDIAASPLNEHWKNMKKLCVTELFTAYRVDSYLPVRMEELSHLLSAIVKTHHLGETVEVRKLLISMTHNVMTRILISLRYFNYGKYEEATPDSKEAEEFKNVCSQVSEESLQFHIGDFVPSYLRWIDWTIPKIKQVHTKVDSFLEKVLMEHKAQHRIDNVQDFVDIMIEYFQGEKDDIIKAVFLDLIIGGTETSATVSEFILMELLLNPQIMLKVQEELDSVVGHNRIVEEADFHKLVYLNAVIKEVLRLHPPVPLLVPHMSTVPCKLAGYNIPSGCTTFVNVYAISTDKNVWGEDALEFRPERFFESSVDVKGRDFELLPFGSGRRICPGMLMGLKTVQLIVSNLLHSFEWKFVAGKTCDMEETSGSVIWLKSPLEVLASPRF